MTLKTSTPENDFPPSPIKILIMGAPGARKTTLLLEFPGVHVLDCDRNLDGPKRFIRHGYQDPASGANVAPPNAALVFGYEPIRYDNGEQRDIADCYDAVIDECNRIASDRQAYNGVRCVGVDSLSHINEFILRKVMKMKGSTINFQTQWWTEFKSLAYQLLVSKLEKTGLPIICTAHEIKLVEADKDKITQQRVLGYEPFFQGKVGDTIGAFFTDVWRMEIRPSSAGRVDTILQTTRTNMCDYLKNSLGMPAEVKIDDGWKHLGYSAIESYLKGRI
jgi:hypothetical protein